MIPTPPADPALPNFPLLFSGDAIAGLLEVHGAARDGASIIRCRPTYVRYKPGTSCLVAYELDLRTETGMVSRKGHIRAFADDRGRRRMEHPRLRKLVERATADLGALELAWTAFIPEVNGVFSLFPIDYDLRPLVKVTTAASARKHLRRMLGDKGLALIGEPETIRFKPGRKALLRYRTSRGAVYVKVHADDRGAMVRSATEALAAAGLRTPAVLGTNTAFRFIAHEDAPGVRLASLRGDARFPEMLERLAGPLALLHRTPVEGLPVHHLGDEMDRLRETASLLGLLVPAQQQQLDRIVGVLEDRLTRIDEVLATNHGDFYDDQAIVNGGDIALIDLDGIRLAHPMLDIGNMLAHLRAGTARDDALSGAREAFIDGMRRHRAMDAREIATFEAIGLLHLAPESFRRLDPAWPDAIDGMVGLIEDVLRSPVPPDLVSGDTTPGTSSGGTGRVAILDEKLPELPALQDPGRMEAALRQATGDTGLVLEGISVWRHKPGRRAIIRYDIAGAAPIWGKVFASTRGPRVHEITRAICDARAFGPVVALPDPVAFLPDLRVLLQRAVPGEPITARLLAGDTALAERIARAIHAFHASGLDLGREHDLDKELSLLHGRVDDLRERFPALGEEATALHARLREMAGTLHAWRSLPVHRDFYDAQVLVDGERLSMLDLDDAAMSEPAVDIANFAAHLDLMALRHPGHESGVMAARGRFLERSRALDPALDERLLAFLMATTLLRLAGIHAPREDGERIAQGLLQSARKIVSRIAPKGRSTTTRIPA